VTESRTLVRAERTDRWPKSRLEIRAARQGPPSGCSSVAAQQPAESLVDHRVPSFGCSEVLAVSPLLPSA